MSLEELDVDLDDQSPLDENISRWLVSSQQRIQQFWDQFPQKPLAQYVECDFDWLARGIKYCIDHRWNDGQLFVEWGCGFGVVTGIASLLGLEAIGIEAEKFLADEALILLKKNKISAEIWYGNFLPPGADRLSVDDDPIVSLSHRCLSAYEDHQMSLDDFAMVYAYPWPGEEHFLKLVFDRYARENALMLLYRGPFHLEIYRKR